MAAPPASATPVLDTEPTNTPDKFSFKDASFDEVLEDLSSRFILNLPEDELAEVERVCFQVEQAHWYYEDFIREENPSFPSLPLKKFSEILFRSCPLLHHWSADHESAFNGFMSYKTRVPVCGAIMLNESLTKCVLVKGWKSSAGWGFPKGKVNENEDEALCAAREVLEETGYNLNGQIRRTDCIQLCVKQQPITLFVVAGVPEDFPFKTQTRKEISKIDWFKLADLPTWKKNRSVTNKFYLIAPVIGPLKAIVRNLRKERKAAKSLSHTHQVNGTISLPEEEELELQNPGLTVTTGSLVNVGDGAPRSQSCEAEISSSQSSSIDPHTPSVNGDLGPHMSSGDKFIFKDTFSNVEDSSMEADMDTSIEATPLGLQSDPRTHWSRLMTRLNHSQEGSPLTTPQAATPTPPIATTLPPPKLQPPDGNPPHQDLGIVENSKDVPPRRPLVAARSTSLSSPSVVPERSANTSSVPPRSGPTSQSTSAEQLVKRTRQLQLLDSVLAEETARRSPHPAPPMSAHTLGAYPRPSSMLLPNELHMPLRSASVNPEVVRNEFAPYHHQHKHSVSGASPYTSLQQQVFRSPYSPAPHPQGGRPPPLRLQQQPGWSVTSTYGQSPLVDTAHKGQMLSILSARSALPRSSTFTIQGSASPPGSCSSASTVGPSHLLSILNNNPSPSRAGPVQDHPNSRQLQGG